MQPGNRSKQPTEKRGTNASKLILRPLDEGTPSATDNDVILSAMNYVSFNGMWPMLQLNSRVRCYSAAAFAGGDARRRMPGIPAMSAKDACKAADRRHRVLDRRTAAMTDKKPRSNSSPERNKNQGSMLNIRHRLTFSARGAI